MIRIGHRRLRLLALPLLLSAGCFSLSPAPVPPVYRYQLAYPPPPAAVTRLPSVLRLLPLRSAATCDRSDIVYRDSTHRLDTYNYRRWIVPPGRMVGDLLERDLVESQLFRAVLQGPSPISADYVLGGVVEEIEERRGDPCTAHLRVRLVVSRNTGPGQSEAIFQRVYEADEPCGGEDTDDLVAAMSRALSSISTRLRADLFDTINGLGSTSENPR